VFPNGIVGSLIIVGIATAISVPLGVAAAIYLNEYRGRLASLTRFLADVLVGIPTIVTGAFVYAIWVVEFGFSGWAGGIALALIMLPLIIRSTEEMLRLVPHAKPPSRWESPVPARSSPLCCPLRDRASSPASCSPWRVPWVRRLRCC
jgi:ABC-type molybdate transport system permease subunit